MAIKGQIPIEFGMVFPDGAYAAGCIEMVRDFDRSTADRLVQQTDKETGLPLWVVEVGAPYHAVVVAGVDGDGSVDGTNVTVYNPWPPGSGAVETRTFADFERDFELGAGSRAAILHR